MGTVCRAGLRRLGAYNYEFPEEVVIRREALEILVFVDEVLINDWESCGGGVTFPSPIEEDAIVSIMWLRMEGDRGCSGEEGGS